MAFWRLYYHLVWATKNREPFIQANIESRLYAYAVNKAAELACYVYCINGWYDHIHLIIAIPPKHAVAEVVKCLKGASSHDLNHGGGRLDYQFAWQRGYGALSLGSANDQRLRFTWLTRRLTIKHKRPFPGLNATRNLTKDQATAGSPLVLSLPSCVSREPPTFWRKKRHSSPRMNSGAEI